MAASTTAPFESRLADMREDYEWLQENVHIYFDMPPVEGHSEGESESDAGLDGATRTLGGGWRLATHWLTATNAYSLALLATVLLGTWVANT